MDGWKEKRNNERKSKLKRERKKRKKETKKESKKNNNNNNKQEDRIRRLFLRQLFKFQQFINLDLRQFRIEVDEH